MFAGNVHGGLPGTIPAPLPAWAKWALYLATTPPASYLVDALEFLGAVPDFTQPGSSWRHVQMIWNNSGTTDTADRAMTTFDIANITGGVLDDSWTAQDYTTCDTYLVSLATTWSAHMSLYGHALELRYYKRAFNPYSNDKPFQIGGPPEHVTALTSQGSAASYQAPQVALTHTEKTTYPRHWGRCYWPFPGANMVVEGGLAQSSIVDAWATQVHNTYDALQSQEFFPCVPTTTVLGAPSRNLLGVTAVQVDNVLDVIRRRRIHSTTHRNSQPV